MADQSIVLTDGTGAKHTWTRKSAGGYTPPEGEDGILALDTAGRVTLTEGADVYVFRPDGKLDTQSSVLDSRKPATLQNLYDGTPSRLREIRDPVSQRAHRLFYNRPGDDCYAGVTPPPGAAMAPPAQMLCRIAYWDGTETRLWYYPSGNLARIEDPGSEITGFHVDGNGMITAIRDPLAHDWVAADPTTRNTLATFTTIGYAGLAGRIQATSVTAPEPTPGQAKPRHSYRYDAANRQTFVDVAGLSPATGFFTKVTYDDSYRLLSTTDATGRTTSQTWNAKDQLLTATDPAGRVSTTVYDHADRATDSYGPATASCFSGQLPTPACANTVPHQHTGYDEGLRGLSVAWHDNASLTGAPKVYTTGVGTADGRLAANWPGVPTAGIPADFWSFRATGEIVFPAAGSYTLRAWVDDGIRIWVDDQLILDAWVGSFPAWRDATPITATAGQIRRIRVEHMEVDLANLLELHWTTPTGTQEFVPGANLRPRYGLATSTVTTESDGVPDQTSSTRYDENGLDPVYGLATSATTGSGGLALVSRTGYEPVGSGYLRGVSKTMPTGAQVAYTHYGDTETRANPCVPGSPAVNQGGMAKSTTLPTPAAGPARTDEQVHDLSGRVVAKATSGDWTCTTFDVRDRVITQTTPAYGGAPARTVTTNYAVAGDPLVTSITDPAGTVTTRVDLLGRVVAYTDVHGVRTDTVYDQAGRVGSETVTFPTPADPPQVTTYSYDDAGRLLSHTLGATTLATSAYDAAGELATVGYANGSSLAAIGKDPAGRMVSVTWRTSDNETVIATVGRTRSGTIIDETLAGTDARPGAPNYVYDEVGRLTEAWVTGHHYSYDHTSQASASCPAGTQPNAGLNTNRVRQLDQTAAGTVETGYCYDAADRIRATTGPSPVSSVGYDTHGNTTGYIQGGATTSLSWDGAGRNVGVAVTGADPASVVYHRDAADRIVRRNAVAGDTATAVLYGYTAGGDSADVTLDAAGRVLTRTVGLPGGVLHTVHGDGATLPRWDHPTVRGDLCLTTDVAGRRSGSLRVYGPFGEPLALSGAVDPDAVPDNQPGQLDYGWLGQYQRPYEHAGALSLVQMGARPYSPLLGRFLSVDPVDGGGLNDYEYVGADPINTTDLDGKCWICRKAKAVGRAVVGGAKKAGKWAMRNRGAIMTAVATGVCLVPVYGWASCGALQAAALVFRSEQRASNGGGWGRTWRANLGDGIVTAASVGLGRFLMSRVQYAVPQRWLQRNREFTPLWQGMTKVQRLATTVFTRSASGVYSGGCYITKRC